MTWTDIHCVFTVNTFFKTDESVIETVICEKNT